MILRPESSRISRLGKEDHSIEHREVLVYGQLIRKENSMYWEHSSQSRRLKQVHSYYQEKYCHSQMNKTSASQKFKFHMQVPQEEIKTKTSTNHPVWRVTILLPHPIPEESTKHKATSLRWMRSLQTTMVNALKTTNHIQHQNPT